MSDAGYISEQVRRIVASGALGRSRSYARLLEYLAECSQRGHRPKEVEIAAEVFDSAQDAQVRVYVHNLRRKLQRHYAATPPVDGRRLTIPRGEYRLLVETVERTAEETGRRRRMRIWVAAVAVVMVVNAVVIALAIDSERDDDRPPGEPQQVAGSALWSGLLGDDMPILVVVGDYFIFAELDEFGAVRRLVREFDVNSSEDLDSLFVVDPDRLASYMDLDLTYLPQGSASALSELLRVVYAADKDVQVTSMTEMRVADLKSRHILYVGYISALGTLMDFVFASSGLRVGASFDELENTATGESYTSGAGIPGSGDYKDYGLISTFSGPEGNRFLIVAGTRDSGLMHAAQAVASLEDIRELDDVAGGAAPAGGDGDADGSAPAAAASGGRTASNDGFRAGNGAPAASDAAPAFEALYEVTGFDRINLDATLVYKARLDYRPIWGLEVAAAPNVAGANIGGMDIGGAGVGSPDTGRTGIDGADAGRSDAGRVDADGADAGRSDAGRADTDGADADRSDAGRVDTDGADADRSDIDRADADGAGSGRTSPDRGN